MIPFITLDGLSWRAPDGRTLFENLTLSFGGERTGVVGRNGCGKTTLLKLMLGELEPAAGVVTRRGRIGLLRQAQAAPEGAVLEDLLGVAEGLERLDRIESGEGSGEDFDLADWDLAARIEAALAEVGLEGLSLDRPAASLSGGQRTRTEIARLLIARPDLILLDEPTNNLDGGGRALVAEALAAWPGGAVVVSHDRTLLKGMDRIVELSGLGARVYGGGWDLYAERKEAEEGAAVLALDSAEREARRVDRALQQTRERKARSDAAGRRARARGDAPKMLLDARADRAEATGARQSRLAERLRDQAQADLSAAQARVERIRRLDFELPPSGLAEGKLVLAFEQVSFAWPGGPRILDQLSFRLTGPQRLAVAGGNGRGKTTLIRLAEGQVEPDAGRIVRGVPAVVLDQQAALLQGDLSLIDNFRRLNPGLGDNAAHAALARFLFRNAAALKLARDLSGGERLRAALACVLMAERPPQLIILDEPTNHLDLDSIAAVEAALAAYDGALIVVSHDEAFLDALGVKQRLPLDSPLKPAG
ncbi:ABC-F family ATP-binding cassette domain-containing protein [Phenylobacterium montanum]|uniref:ABC-F family ATP-binding cassette domain-containing protein n=1 Tax=Phenylobacterium montanum TaxID=2823693 RepID=A0A975G278_9CAUL|nr:ABC-F family ATP-binding cassette domain-containing protein [Caulobacter sp. S6]QUD89142.1 ABC-F family ATP-binding cassette domain-containing protein [Caulobacter sp. S6]